MNLLYQNYSSLPQDSQPEAIRRIPHLTRVLRPYLPGDPDSAIADLGCGYGAALAALGGLGYRRITGVDASPLQVAFARERLGIASISVGNALDWLNGREEEFDAILAIDLLEHLQLSDLLSLLRAVARALKPRGRLIVQVPNAMAPLNPHTYGDVTHVTAFTVRSLSQAFALAGLQTAHIAEPPIESSGILGHLRRIVWTVVLRPSLRLIVVALHGGYCSGELLTSNIVAVAERTQGSAQQR
ncbi:MAG: class I SAM-dependent methyltransferase [Acidobacteria bacterium]|nr:class I SAM-dependent methyltransferase [Acidobacteriota bacterium]